MKTIKFLLITLTVLVLTGCAPHGLHGTQFIYHQSHSESNHVNSNGLHK